MCYNINYLAVAALLVMVIWLFPHFNNTTTHIESVIVHSYLIIFKYLFEFDLIRFK